jgi:hypothetical protein
VLGYDEDRITELAIAEVLEEVVPSSVELRWRPTR